MQKDLGATAKEIARQEKRIQEYKDDPTREPEDVKKQEEVLAEYLAGRTDEKNRLGEFAETLAEVINCMGGIATADDILDYISVGADAVAVGTMNFTDPMICPALIETLDERLDEGDGKSRSRR